MALRRRLLFVAIVGFCVGCGSSAPVDAPKAKQALVVALDAWKRGDKPESLKPVVVQDMDWTGGAKLVAYELGNGKDDNLNLRCPVKLKLVGADGKEIEKTVTYMVGTSPVTTVFREFSM